MTTEQAVQGAKDSIKNFYPNAEFVNKEFTPTPWYYDIFDESVLGDVVCLATFSICVRKNESSLNEQIIEAKNKVGKHLSSEYIVDFLEFGEPFEPTFDFKLPAAAEEAIRFLAKEGIQTTILPKPSKDQEREIRDIVAKYEQISPSATTSNAPLDSSSDRLSEASSEFNDTLLDEQKKKIDDLEERLKKADSDYMDKVHLACVRGKEIARLGKIIHDKNVMIKNLISDRGKVARELTAEKAVHKVDLQATKSAESALLYHEKEYKKSLQEKDEVIDDLSKELARSKEREEELIATVKDYVNEIEELKGNKKPKPKMHFSAPKQGRVIVFSSRNPRNSFLDELRKSFFED